MTVSAVSDTHTTERGNLPQQLVVDSQGFLIVMQGEGTGREVQLKDTPLMLGRSSECDVRLLNRAVSRLHCRVWRDGTGFWLRDLNSTNKTYLNERPVVEARLKDGDSITVGGTILRFIVRGGDTTLSEAAPIDYATTDPLTGLANRRYFETELDKEIARSARNGRSFALVLLEIDGHSRLLQTYGQEVIDDALRSLGKMVLGGLRQEDTAGRTGGVDFALLLVEVNADNAASIMQAIRSAIANAQFGPNRQVRVTISAGLAIWLKESTIDRSSLMKLAESQLERAKGLGGNRVCHIGGMDAA